MKCPSCGSELASKAWVCEVCFFVIDSEMLGKTAQEASPGDQFQAQGKASVAPKAINNRHAEIDINEIRTNLIPVGAMGLKTVEMASAMAPGHPRVDAEVTPSSSTANADMLLPSNEKAGSATIDTSMPFPELQDLVQLAMAEVDRISGFDNETSDPTEGLHHSSDPTHEQFNDDLGGMDPTLSEPLVNMFTNDTIGDGVPLALNLAEEPAQPQVAIETRPPSDTPWPPVSDPGPTSTRISQIQDVSSILEESLPPTKSGAQLSGSSARPHSSSSAAVNGEHHSSSMSLEGQTIDTHYDHDVTDHLYPWDPNDPALNQNSPHEMDTGTLDANAIDVHPHGPSIEAPPPAPALPIPSFNTAAEASSSDEIDRSRRRSSGPSHIDARPKSAPATVDPPPRSRSLSIQAQPSMPPANIELAKAAQFYRKAQKDQREGRANSALANMRLALTFNPKNLQYAEAMQSMSQGSSPSEAISKTNIRTARMLYQKATTAQDLGAYEEAIELLQQALRLYRQPALLNRLAVIFATHHRDFATAQDLLEEAISRAPGKDVYVRNLDKVLAMASATSGDEAAQPKVNLWSLLGIQR